MGVKEIKKIPQQYLCDVTERERKIEEALIQSVGFTKKLGDELANTLRYFLVLVKDHQQALVTRLKDLPSSEISVNLDVQEGYSSLSKLFAAINQVIFDYSLLHTFAHRFLEQSNNDLVALAQILGHENLDTTAIYTKRGQDELASRVENLRYDAPPTLT